MKEAGSLLRNALENGLNPKMVIWPEIGLFWGLEHPVFLFVTHILLGSKKQPPYYESVSCP